MDHSGAQSHQERLSDTRRCKTELSLNNYNSLTLLDFEVMAVAQHLVAVMVKLVTFNSLGHQDRLEL